MEITSKLLMLAVIVSGAAAVAGASALAAEPPAVVAGSPVETPTLSLTEIEARLSKEGVKVKGMEIRDLIVEVEGHDAQGREIDIVVDRRSGEILSRQFDR